MQLISTTKSRVQTTYPSVESRGYLHSFDFDLIPYTGVDFSRQAFIFSGQGQMNPGIMRKYCKSHPIFRQRLSELDDFCSEQGLKAASSYILSTDKKSDPEINQKRSLCLLTLQVSMFEAMLFHQNFPTIVTGHSFGEFASLVCSGVFKLRDMWLFLLDREKAIAPMAHSHTMFAVNKDLKNLLPLEDFSIEMANRNTSQQYSYVCEKNKFSSIRNVLKKHKIAAVPLDIAHPYHTHWMKPSFVELKNSVQKQNFQLSPPSLPFVSSVLGKIIDKKSFRADEVLASLTSQLLTPVNFPKQLELIIKDRVQNFVELSPVDVLTPFVEKELRQNNIDFKSSSFRNHVRPISNQKKKETSLKNSKVMSVINSALKSLTGYTFEDVDLEDRIREDLGIDSIKKAEIVFEVVNSMNEIDHNLAAPVNLAELATFSDILKYFENTHIAQKELKSNLIEKSSEFSPLKKIWIEKPAVDFRVHGSQTIQRVSINEKGEIDTSELSKDSDILCIESDFSPQKDYFEKAIEWIHIFKNTKFNSRHLIFVHQGSIFEKCLGTFLLSVALERKMTCKIVQSPSTLSDDQLIIEQKNFFDTFVRYDQNQKRWSRSMHKGENHFQETAKNFDRVIFFGGLGGVGSHLMETLKPKELVVIGRRPQSSEIIPSLQQKFSTAQRIEYISADLQNSTDLQKIISKHIQGSNSELVVHCIGVEHSEILEKLTSEQIRITLDAKMKVAEVLAQCAQQNPNTQFVFNSSLISEFGNPGQAPYGFANRYLNELCDGSDNIVNFVWPAWLETGMAKNQFISHSLKLQGLPSLAPAQAKEIFSQFLNQQGNYFIMASDYLPEYYAMNHVHCMEQPLLKTASRNRQLYLLEGITQKKLPYLKDHLVKKACLFPASGSIALMLYRYYQEFGHLGKIQNFSTRNFFVVHPDKSHHFLSSHFSAGHRAKFEIKSSQPIADGEIVSFSSPDIQQIQNLNYHLELRDHLDESYAVYIGPKFKLQQGIFFNKETHALFLKSDLQKTHEYTGIEIIDKLHKLIEYTFHAAGFKGLWEFQKTLIPKHVGELTINEEALKGFEFYALCEEIRRDSENQYICDLLAYNSKGEIVLQVKDFRCIEVGFGRTREEFFDVISNSDRVQSLSFMGSHV